MSYKPHIHRIKDAVSGGRRLPGKQGGLGGRQATQHGKKLSGEVVNIDCSPQGKNGAGGGGGKEILVASLSPGMVASPREKIYDFGTGPGDGSIPEGKNIRFWDRPRPFFPSPKEGLMPPLTLGIVGVAIDVYLSMHVVVCLFR